MPERAEPLHIICYKWGTKYPADYVLKLRAMVGRHLTVPHTFHCITDDGTGLGGDIQVHPLPDFGFEGIWRKLHTFSDNFLGLNGQYVISLDLDIVIARSIDFLADDPDKDFIVGRNWWTDGRASGAAYRLKVGSHNHIWDDFVADPQAAIDAFHGKNRFIGEQKWLDHKFDNFDHFPDGKVISYKYHCRSKGLRLFGGRGEKLGLTTAVFSKARLPENAAIVSFHGDPSPDEVMDGRWGIWKQAPFVRDHWRV